VFEPLPPSRILDTRDTAPPSPLGPGGLRDIQIGGIGAGTATVAADATAVAVNVTVTQPSTASYLTVWPAGQARPGVSAMIWPAAATKSTLVVSQIGADGNISLYNAAGTAHVIIDIVGYWRPAAAAAPPQTVNSTYDRDALRQSKTVNSTQTTTYTWDTATAGLPLLLSDGTDRCIYGPDGTPIEKVAVDGTPTWLHQDRLGSTRTLTDQTGTVVGTYDYDPYGQTTTHTGTYTPLQWAGQYTDTETGLQYLRARYYDPTTTQFLTPDPITPITRQPYQYAAGNPINHTDPTGLCVGVLAGADTAACIGAGVGAAGTSLAGALAATPPGAVVTAGAAAGATIYHFNLLGLNEPCESLGGWLYDQLFAEDALDSTNEAQNAGGSSVDEILAGLRSGRTPPNRAVETPEELEVVWERLSSGGRPVESGYPGELVTLPDGTRVGLRPESRSGGGTIDIWRPRETSATKVHLP